jgi:hypothetical protein
VQRTGRSFNLLFAQEQPGRDNVVAIDDEQNRGLTTPAEGYSAKIMQALKPILRMVNVIDGGLDR